VLKFLQEFVEAVFLGVDKISLIDTDGVWSSQTSVRLEYQLNRSTTLDPAVGSCSNFYKSFWRLF
jgi:hypothetical protein